MLGNSFLSFYFFAFVLCLISMITVVGSETSEKYPSQVVHCNYEACKPTGKANMPNWMRFHTLLVQEALERAKSQDNPVNVLFLGDSITEHLRGTSFGHPRATLKPSQLVWEKEVARLGALALAISGDTTENLLWRLQNGELPSSLQPKVVVLHIGTNNFKKTDNDEEISSAISFIVQYLADVLPNAQIIILGILPRYGIRHDPDGDLRKRVTHINRQVQDFSYSSEERISFIDCQDVFLVDNSDAHLDYNIDQELMADFLHPTAKGYHKLFKCLLPIVKRKLEMR